MAEFKGHVDEDEVMGEKRITLRSEFKWFLSEEFAMLNEHFKPVDYSIVLRETDKDLDQGKEKLPPIYLARK